MQACMQRSRLYASCSSCFDATWLPRQRELLWLDVIMGFALWKLLGATYAILAQLEGRHVTHAHDATIPPVDLSCDVTVTRCYCVSPLQELLDATYAILAQLDKEGKRGSKDAAARTSESPASPAGNKTPGRQHSRPDRKSAGCLL